MPPAAHRGARESRLHAGLLAPQLLQLERQVVALAHKRSHLVRAGARLLPRPLLRRHKLLRHPACVRLARAQLALQMRALLGALVQVDVRRRLRAKCRLRRVARRGDRLERLA